MKRIILALIFSLSIFAAVPTGPTMQWDVRTTGNDANSGSYVTGLGGTDFSQQDSPQIVYTDLLVGTPNTTVTSVAHPFNSTIPGNVIYITSGPCSGDYFVVTGVVGVVATLNNSPGATGGTCGGNLGGGLQTIHTVVLAAKNSNVINIKAGTYTQTGTEQPLWNGTVIGYQTVHGDNGTHPLITTATNSTILWRLNGAVSNPYQMSFSNINFSNTAGTRAAAFSFLTPDVVSLTVQNSVMDGFSSAITSLNFAQWVQMQSVEIKNSVSHAVVMSTTGTTMSTFTCNACWIHNNGGDGINLANQAATIVSNSIINLNANGITTNGSSLNSPITVYDSDISLNTTDGIQTNNIAAVVVASNSIFWGNGQYGINFGAAAQAQQNIIGANNAYGGNGTAALHNVAASPGDITLASNPFTSATNFALNSTANGGTLLKGTGYPGVFPGGASTGSIDVGAVQSPTPTPTTGAPFTGELLEPRNPFRR